ncbi:MAG: UDP-3-O-(3-hydroxymyristoyl)glucosamine N-acyltransferase [Gammaproteobacteria bacterium]|nr:UDP-3-O-(3-hydroxymyristoyl)glucosamine N-acyltransferase [Gammaproteobacteria bacterium]
MAVTLAELAQRFQARLRGDGTIAISGVATLEAAGPGDLAYVSNPAYQKYLSGTRAGALVLNDADAGLYSGNALITANPQLCFARIAALFNPLPAVRPGRHPSAVIDAAARVAASAWIGPQAVIEGGAAVEDNVFIGPGCIVGQGAAIGADTRLIARVTVAHGCRIGRRCIVHPGAVVGSDGFGYAKDGERWVKVPQLGRVVVGDDVEIGANTAVDRGALGDTVIGDGVKLDNLVQIAHNVQIGEHTAMAGCVGVAGSAVIGKRCAIGGQVGIAGHLQIADDVTVMGTSLVGGSLTRPGVYSSSMPAEPAEQWRKNAARFRHLDEMAKRLKELERKIEQLFTQRDRS